MPTLIGPAIVVSVSCRFARNSPSRLPVEVFATIVFTTRPSMVEIASVWKIIGLTLVAMVVALWIRLSFVFRSRRPQESGFPYVYVNRNGSARELTADEHEYLNTKFAPGGGARPYIKYRYESLTPDGLISGYLKRRQLPAQIEVQPAPLSNEKPLF